MSWLKRVMNVLGNGDEEEIEEDHSVELAALPEWVDGRAKKSFEKIKPRVEALFSEFFEQRRSLLKHLEELSMAQLQNPNISERERQIMEGNRTTYISQHQHFAKQIEFPTELTLSITAQFCRNFEEMLVKLAKTTAKGHAITSQFFGDHANRINKNVKAMSDSINKVGDVLEESDISVKDLDALRKAVLELKTKKKFITDLEHESKVFKTKLANSNAYKDKLMKKMEELKLTDGYTEFKKANKEKEELKKIMKDAEEDVHALFSAIQRPMKKYERVLAENINLFKHYIDDPIKGLVDDEQIMIVSVLERMRRAVNDGQLGLDDKEKEKVSAKIDAITKDKLSSARTTYVDAKRQIKVIDDSIRMNGTLQELDDMSYKVEHTDTQINLLEEKIEKAKKSLDKIDLEKMRDSVVQQIADVLSAEIELTWHQPESMVEKEAQEL
ncbi:hypothetical protein KY362_00525 [Candidatus Woesearchaeota archaeon]|nr:hypothetical protein [Candidatus Woesearchaeota archaeon]